MKIRFITKDGLECVQEVPDINSRSVMVFRPLRSREALCSAVLDAPHVGTCLYRRYRIERWRTSQGDEWRAYEE